MLDLYNMDIYNLVLDEILGIGHKMTGDVVADTVYLFVLPILTLFLFSHHIAGMMRLSKSKLQYVFMAIIFFFVVQRGYYPLVADYSMFAFIVLMIWGAWDFITGRKSGKSSSGNDMGTYNMGVGSSDRDNKKSFLSRGLNLVGSARNLTNAGTVMHNINKASGGEELVTVELEKRLVDLMKSGGSPKEIRELQETIAMRKNLKQFKST